ERRAAGHPAGLRRGRQHDGHGAVALAGQRRGAGGRAEEGRPRRVDRARVRPAHPGDPRQEEGRPDRGRRGAHAEGRGLREAAPGPAPGRRRARHPLALLADELGPRPGEV
ncbi:MAG: DNA-binding protein, partial [uncultured Friedmanniella sp.]